MDSISEAERDDLIAHGFVLAMMISHHLTDRPPQLAKTYQTLLDLRDGKLLLTPSPADSGLPEEMLEALEEPLANLRASNQENAAAVLRSVSRGFGMG